MVAKVEEFLGAIIFAGAKTVPRTPNNINNTEKSTTFCV